MMDRASTKKKKKKEEVQDIDSEEKDNASEETVPDSPGGGGGDEVNQEEEGEKDKQEKGEVTPPKDPLTEARCQRKGRFLHRNPQRGRSPEPISLSHRMCSPWMTSSSSSQLSRMLQKTSCRDMEKNRSRCMTE
jgi:hypothetical protein